MDALIPAAFTRPRLLVLASLGLLAALAWAYTGRLAADMGAMAAMPMPAVMPPWTLAHAAFMLGMWSVMMVAMMVPSAAPMVLCYHHVHRQRIAQGRPATGTGLFLAGYLLAWGGFSLAATSVQWALQAASLLSPGMMGTHPTVGGALLLAAGVYQWLPWKDACLAKCRSPLGFLIAEWREGARGALVMGLRHGAFCVGCCWALMALLFVGGVMNLRWVAALTAYVMLEKMVPGGGWVGRVTGAALAGWGGWMLAGALV